MGMWLIAYVDNILVLAEFMELLINQAARMCYLLKNLGFLMNQKKSILKQSQNIKFPGFTVDTVMMEIKPSIWQPTENHGGVPEVRKGGSALSQIVSTVNGKNECHFSGNSPGPFVLSTLANEVVEQGSPILWNLVNTGPARTNRDGGTTICEGGTGRHCWAGKQI